MKKFSTLLLLLLVTLAGGVNSAWAADARWTGKYISKVSEAITSLDGLQNGYYLLRNNGRQTFLRENSDNGLYLWDATNGSATLSDVQNAFVGSDKDVMTSVVLITKNIDGTTYTMQFSSGNYLPETLPQGGQAFSNAAWKPLVEVRFVSDNLFCFRPVDTFFANGNGSGGHTDGTFTGWTASAPTGGNGVYQFFPVTLADTETNTDYIVTTWNATTGNGASLATLTTDVLSGATAEMPAFESGSYYTNPTIVETDKTVSESNHSFTVHFEAQTLPFSFSNADAPIWYTIHFRGDNSHYLVHVINTDNGIGSSRSLTADFCGSYWGYDTFNGALWAFVQDGFGVKLLNKQTGKYVRNTSSDNRASLNGLNHSSSFVLKTNTYNNSAGFSLQVPGSETTHLGDHASGALAGWNYAGGESPSSQNDGGSCFQITEINDDILAVAKEAMKKPRTYNTTMLTALHAANLAKYTDQIDAAADLAALDAVYNTIKTSAFIPETGVYYRIKNCNLTDDQKSYVSSENIFVGTDGALSTSYNKFGDKSSSNTTGVDRVIRRVPSTGHLLSQLWEIVDNDNGTCQLKNVNNGCRISSYVSSGLYMPINVNEGGDFTVKAVPTATFANNDGLTMLQLLLSGYRINAFQGDVNDIISDYSGNHDNDKGNYWQFVKVTEVPFTIGTAGWASVALPFEVTIPAESGVTAYTAQRINGDKMILEEIQDGVIPANEGVILAKEGGTSVNLAITSTGKATISGNLLQPATAKRIGFDADATYVLAMDGDDVAFLQSALTSVPANKAWLPAAEVTSLASVLSFVPGTADGINGATISADAENETYYDLNGRPVLYPRSGVYVTKSGKKVLFK